MDKFSENGKDSDQQSEVLSSQLGDHAHMDQNLRFAAHVPERGAKVRRR